MRMRGIYLARRAISVSDSELDLSVSFVKGFVRGRERVEGGGGEREGGKRKGVAMEVVVVVMVVVPGKQQQQEIKK